MESTFQRFIENDPEQKKAFDKEYDAFALSEFVLEQMQNRHLSPKELAKKAHVSPSLIKKMSKSETSGKVNQHFLTKMQASYVFTYGDHVTRTPTNLINYILKAALGYRLTFQSR